MKKLLIASAALALSTSFAFASSYHHTPTSFSFALTTGDNTSKIYNVAVATKGGEVYQTNINTVQQNTGLFIQPIGLFGNGLGGGL